ncbi:MAG: hypothetical protein NTV45_02955 [Firmicutes bacterium]|nr:hypothetical protein [Bacillota bacterium]
MKPYPLERVEFGADRVPCCLWHQGQYWQVSDILDRWQDTGCWWAGESEKDFYRLILEDRSVREIFYDQTEMRWYLYKTYD